MALLPSAAGSSSGQPQHNTQAHINARDKLRVVMSEGLGDHVMLLRLWQLWQRAAFSRDFCREYGLDLRGMNFAKDLRRQLEGAAAVTQ